ncbi:MAG: hypothetical protein KDC41_26630, partial [Saprospiraceae bacterium]|nr:hypothetical protein [Saprospiraceae bacterium]
PPNGTSNVNTGLPSFAWEGSPFADTYDFQLATSPAFGNSIVDEGTFLPETEFDVNVVLEETTLYYWRVRARNLCGDSDWLPPFAFHTETLACNEFNSIDVPLGIPALGTPTRESELSIAAGGTINDVNVVNLTGYHDGVKDIAMRVISPEGTVVTLFSGICGNTAPFDLGLDDESPLVLTCPPTDGQPHQPQGSLSDFDGESTAGVWTLQVQVIDDFGAGGLVESWGLEFCASFDPKNPVLVNNETLLVQPG